MADGEPRTAAEIVRELAGRWPGPGPRALGEMVVAALVPMAQAPPRGLWRTKGGGRNVALSSWLGRPVPARARRGRPSAPRAGRRYWPPTHRPPRRTSAPSDWAGARTGSRVPAERTASATNGRDRQGLPDAHPARPPVHVPGGAAPHRPPLTRRSLTVFRVTAFPDIRHHPCPAKDLRPSRHLAPHSRATPSSRAPTPNAPCSPRRNIHPGRGHPVRLPRLQGRQALLGLAGVHRPVVRAAGRRSADQAGRRLPGPGRGAAAQREMAAGPRLPDARGGVADGPPGPAHRTRRGAHPRRLLLDRGRPRAQSDPTDFLFVRRGPDGGWETGAFERGAYDVLTRHPDEAAACGHLLELLV
ncbi:hypothetical protein SCALM49S_07651 [Streptomyces californicus]